MFMVLNAEIIMLPKLWFFSYEKKYANLFSDKLELLNRVVFANEKPWSAHQTRTQCLSPVF